MTASDRLEIRLPPETLRSLRAEAERRGVSIAQIVREAIALLLHEDRQARMKAAEALLRVGAPVADWPEIERDIEAAHLKGSTR